MPNPAGKPKRHAKPTARVSPTKEALASRRLERPVEGLHRRAQRLQTQLAQYAELFNLAPVGYLTLDRAGVIRRVNAAGAALMGSARSRLAGRKFRPFLCRERRGAFDAFLDAVFTASGRRACEVRLVCDGRARTVWIEAQRTASGRQCAAVLTDVTEWQRAEEALLQRKRQLRALIEAAPFGAHEYELQDDGRLVFVGFNQAAKRILGFDNAQFLGKTLEEAFPPLTQTDLPTAFRAVGATGTPLEEGLFSFARGSRVETYEISAFQSAPRRIAVFFRDVSERKKAEESLRKSEEKFAKLFHASPAAIGVGRLTDGRILDVNEAFAKMFGCAREELIGLDSAESAFWFVPEEHAVLLRRLRESGCIRDEVVQFRHKDGRPVWARTAAEVMDLNGEPCAIVVLVDITARRQAEERLQQMQHQLAHVSRLSTMGEMLSEVVHELGQPLYAILNYARACRNLLNDPAPPARETLLEWSDKIAQIAADAGSVGKRLMAFARRAEPARTPCALNEIVEESLALVAFDVRDAQVRVEAALTPENPTIRADRVQIQQVLVNLLRNAVEALEKTTLQERHIAIRTTVIGRSVEITVADNGIGLPEQGELNVFEPFATTKPHGLGMGLAVSLAIVEGHEGKLWATRRAEKGACFHCAFPLL